RSNLRLGRSADEVHDLGLVWVIGDHLDEAAAAGVAAAGWRNVCHGVCVGVAVAIDQVVVGGACRRCGGFAEHEVHRGGCGGSVRGVPEILPIGEHHADVEHQSHHAEQGGEPDDQEEDRLAT